MIYVQTEKTSELLSKFENAEVALLKKTIHPNTLTNDFEYMNQLSTGALCFMREAAQSNHQTVTSSIWITDEAGHSQFHRRNKYLFYKFPSSTADDCSKRGDRRVYKKL